MRKVLGVATAVLLTFSCGGGGGSSLPSDATSTTTSTSAVPTGTTLKIVPETTRGLTTSPEGLFASGLKPVLVCNGTQVIEPLSYDESGVLFSGERFTNCVLSFVSPQTGSFVYSSLNSFDALGGAVLKLSSDLLLKKVEGYFADDGEVADPDSKLAEFLKEKKCDHDQVANQEEFDKVVIVFWEGDFLGESSLTSYLQEDFNYLVEGIKSQTQADTDKKVKFVVIWDGDNDSGRATKSDLFIIDPSQAEEFPQLEDDIKAFLSGDLTLQELQDKGIVFYSVSDNAGINLKDLLLTIKRLYPAKSYDLIISGHGDGWYSFPVPPDRTVVFEYYDENPSPTLGTYQLAEFLKDLKSQGMNFDLLGFDQCLMGELVSLSPFEDLVNTIVASPMVENGEGWGSVFKSLPTIYQQADSSLEVGKEIVNGFANYYLGLRAGFEAYYGLTAISTSALKELHQSFEAFAGELKAGLDQYIDDLTQVLKDYWGETYSGTSSWAEIPLSWNVLSLNDTDENIDTLLSPIKNATNYYNFGWGDQITPSDFPLSPNAPGMDLYAFVALIGATAEGYKLGYTSDDLPTYYYYWVSNSTSSGANYTFLTPSFGENIVQRALEFEETIITLHQKGEIYSVYVRFEPDETPVVGTGSGLGIVVPALLIRGTAGSLTYGNYELFLQYYSTAFPNYSSFVRETMNALKEAYSD